MKSTKMLGFIAMALMAMAGLSPAIAQGDDIGSIEQYSDGETVTSENYPGDAKEGDTLEPNVASADINTVETPAISVVPYNGSSIFNESDIGQSKGRINVSLTVPPTGLGSNITVVVEITRVAADNGNYPLPSLGGNSTTTAEKVTTEVKFKNDQTWSYFYFRGLDGTPITEKKGFHIHAYVKDETVCPMDTTKTWREYYQEFDDFDFFVVNKSPVIGPGSANTNALQVTKDVPFKIAWSVSDVLADQTNNLQVTWSYDGRMETGTVDASNGTFLKQLVFGSTGDKVVSLTVTDKDGGSDTRRYFYDVVRLSTQTVGGIKWTYSGVAGEVQLGGGGVSSRAVSTSTSGAITIPTTLGGCPVTRIGDYAFYWCDDLTSVTIPEGVTRIGDYAFYWCDDLTSVTIPEGVTSIGRCAFYGCDGLTSVTIPSSVTSIGDRAFIYCSGLTSVTISEGVTSIGDSAFWGCDGLTSVTIPSTVTNIGNYAFRNCNGLKSFIVSQENVYYKSVDGLLLTGDGKKLLARVIGVGDVSIPESVTSIEDSVFRDCSDLTSVTIPEGVTSIGDFAFSGCSGLTSVTIPSSVTNIGNSAFSGCSGLTLVTISEGVTSIGDSAFYGCSGLTSVTIPEGVTSIGDSAFYGCSGLTSVTIPSSVTNIGEYAFSGCSGLTSVTIPEGVTSIGRYAFSGCSGLVSVTIPSSVTDIGYGAFSRCGETTLSVSQENSHYKLVNGLLLTNGGEELIMGVGGDVSIPESVTSIGSSAFSGCSGLTSVTIPEGVTNIGEYAFSGCSGLTSVTISEGVTSIGEGAFYGCSGLTSVTIPSSVTSIGEWAFYGCSGLTSVTISEGVTSIGEMAFDSCSGLTSVTIPSSVTNIGVRAFSGCSGLTSVTISEGVTRIGGYAFSGCSGLTSVTIPSSLASIGEGAFYGCSGLTSVTIPSSVTNIGEWAFSRCSGLTSVTISEGVTNIGEWAFSRCSGLTSVTISEGVTNIGECAFYGCSGLTSVTIPSSVMKIDDETFYSCSSLTSVTISEGVTEIHDLAFSGCSGLTSVTIPSTVTHIGIDAFDDCSGLTSITVPVTCLGGYWMERNVSHVVITRSASSTDIDENAVDYWPNVESVTIAEGVTSIGDSAFHWSGLTSVTIPSSVTNIGESAFSGCSGLTSVTIPEGVTSIGRYAFDDCSGLTSVTISEGVTSIGDWAFEFCAGLTSVTIPSTVMSIGDGAFMFCNGLTSVTISEGVTSIGVRAFGECSSLTSVTIPSSVTNVSYCAFDCSSLTNVLFTGDAPVVEESPFNVPTNCVVKVYPGTTGWDDDGDGKWNGMTIEYRETHTSNTEVAVPYSWMRKYFPKMEDSTEAYESTAKTLAANGHNTIEAAYVAGLDPTNSVSEFRTTVVCSNGLVYVGWTPNLNSNSVERIYTLSGCTDIIKGDWETPIQPWHRFFKVEVSFPKGGSGEETAVANEGFAPTEKTSAACP